MQKQRSDAKPPGRKEAQGEAKRKRAWFLSSFAFLGVFATLRQVLSFLLWLVQVSHLPAEPLHFGQGLPKGMPTKPVVAMVC